MTLKRSRGQKISCLCDTFVIFVNFEILAMFEILNYKWLSLLDFFRVWEWSDNGAHGLNCKIFIISELIFEIYDENYPTKRNFKSLRLFWNFRSSTTWSLFAFFTLMDSFGRSNFWLLRKRKRQSSKNRFWKCAEVRRLFLGQKLFFCKFTFCVSFSENVALFYHFFALFEFSVVENILLHRFLNSKLISTIFDFLGFLVFFSILDLAGP